MADTARTLQPSVELALIRLAQCAWQFYLVASRCGYIILAQRLNAAVRYINTHLARKRCDAVYVLSMYAMIGHPPNVRHMLQWRVARFSTSPEALLAFEKARSVADTAAAAAVAIVLGHLGTYRVVSPT